MATKSILKDVTIRNVRDAKNFIRAMENASGKKSQTVLYSKTYSEASREDIKKIFGDR